MLPELSQYLPHVVFHCWSQAFRIERLLPWVFSKRKLFLMKDDSSTQITYFQLSDFQFPVSSM
jgi:hypothetical protein